MPSRTCTDCYCKWVRQATGTNYASSRSRPRIRVQRESHDALLSFAQNNGKEQQFKANWDEGLNDGTQCSVTVGPESDCGFSPPCSLTQTKLSTRSMSGTKKTHRNWGFCLMN
ncbi:hypothetical protein VTK26DRAFT_9262 [Humicola hyalothermophila]